MVSQNNQIVIVDIEATCWAKEPPPGEQNEIIEIGVCVLDVETTVLSRKRSILVRPTRSRVSKFCTDLTTLTPEQVAAGVSFDDACAILRQDYATEQLTWASWGSYDKRMFQQQCEQFNVAYPFSESHINVKQLYAKLRRKGHRCGMARALRLESLEMEGTHHRGHDDAWNIARILGKLIREDGVHILTEFGA